MYSKLLLQKHFLSYVVIVMQCISENMFIIGLESKAAGHYSFRSNDFFWVYQDTKQGCWISWVIAIIVCVRKEWHFVHYQEEQHVCSLKTINIVRMILLLIYETILCVYMSNGGVASLNKRYWEISWTNLEIVLGFVTALFKFVRLPNRMHFPTNACLIL